MTDLNDINRNVAIGNLAGAIQHREAMARQAELAALLRTQQREQERLSALPKCPKCKLPVEVGAELCPNCRTDIVCTPRLKSTWCHRTLGHPCGIFVRSDASGHIKAILKDLGASIESRTLEAKKLIVDIAQTASPLRLLATLTDKLEEYSQRCEVVLAVEGAKQKEQGGCLFLTGLLMVFLASWGGILVYISKLADGEITWYWNAIMFFVYGVLAFIIASLVMNFLSALDGSGARVFNAKREITNVSKDINASLQQNSPNSNLTLAFPDGVENVTNQCSRLIANLDSLREAVEAQRADWSTLAKFGRAFGVSDMTLPSCAIPFIDHGPKNFSEAYAGEKLIRLLTSSRDAVNAIGVSPASQAQAPIATSPAIESPKGIWIRLPSGKSGGPFQSTRVRQSQAEGKYPPGTEWSISADGPWKVLVESDAKPVQTDALWVRTPEGKRHGPFAVKQVLRAIADGKIPAGSETASSPDGPWKSIGDPGSRA